MCNKSKWFLKKDLLKFSCVFSGSPHKNINLYTTLTRFNMFLIWSMLGPLFWKEQVQKMKFVKILLQYWICIWIHSTIYTYHTIFLGTLKTNCFHSNTTYNPFLTDVSFNTYCVFTGHEMGTLARSGLLKLCNSLNAKVPIM